jgi:cell division protein FtsB
MIEKLKNTRSTFYNMICNLTNIIEKLTSENKSLKNENEQLKQTIHDIVNVIKK